MLHIKCEIICKWWDAETIIRKSQIEQTESAPYAQAAIELLKNYDQSQYRIKIGEESMSLADYNAEREMRIQLLTALGQFLSQSAGMIQSYPGSLPYVVKMIQWALAAFRGSSDIETVLDEAFKAAQTQPPQQQEQQKPDNTLQVQQMRSQDVQAQVQADMAKAQLDSQTKLQINKEDNQTAVLVELIKEGQHQDKLAQQAIGMELEKEKANGSEDS